MTKIIPVEPAAIDLVVQFEESGTFASRSREDPVGNWEIGYGSIWDWRLVPRTRVDADTAPVDEPTARAWLGMELKAAAQNIQNTVHVPLTAGQIAALEDFIYNLGVGNFLSSTLLRRLNMGDYAGAAAQFDRWTHAGGVVMAGLVRRRQAETDLFTGKTPAADAAEGGPNA
jgi:lysozyme